MREAERAAPVLTSTRTFDRGEGLDPVGLDLLRAHAAVRALISAVSREPAFWRAVDAVAVSGRAREAAAFDAASIFGSGRRRRVVVGRILFVAAAAPTRRQATDWLNLLWAYAYWAPPDSPRRGPYPLRDGFVERVAEGARFVAFRGGGKCVKCGSPLAGGARSVVGGSTGQGQQGRRIRREYCGAHESDPLQRWRRDCADRLFEDASHARGLREFELSRLGPRWSDAMPALQALSESPVLGTGALWAVANRRLALPENRGQLLAR